MKEREFVAAVDAVISLRKTIKGADSPTWQRGRRDGEVRLKLPLEIAGEQRGLHLLLMAYPEYPTLKFRIGTECHGKVICRLDYELDATHGNSAVLGSPLIHGPHWHSWELNRAYIGSVLEYDKLRMAESFIEAQKFDAALRWYCAKRNIEIASHGIDLPPRERLI